MTRTVFEPETWGDLEFEDLGFPKGHTHLQAIATFRNGYGVSIVGGQYLYGNGVDTWELAVIKVKGDGIELVYDTGITDDVMGWLNMEQVLEVMQHVSEL